MKDIRSIDIFKFLFSLCVVTIHCYVVPMFSPDWIQYAVIPLIEEAVPFFFTASAYFVIRKATLPPLQKLHNAAVPYIKKMLLIYIVWVSYQIAVEFIITGHIDESIPELLGTVFFKGYGVMWFVWATIILMPLFIFLGRLIKSKWFYILLAFGSLFVQKAFNHYGYQEDLPFYMEWCKWLYRIRDLAGINWIFRGITGLSIGTMFAVSNIIVPRWLSVAMIVIATVQISFETHRAIAFTLPLLAIGAFSLILNLKINLGTEICLILRKLSSLIYFTHISVIMFYTDVLQLDMTPAVWCMIILTCTAWASVLLCISRTPIGRPLSKVI